MENDLADTVFFTGLFMFISSSVNALKYVYRSDPYPEIKVEEYFKSKKLLDKITGYTRHGLDQAMFRDGHGINPKGILDAVRNPVMILYNAERDTYRFVGQMSTTVLNKQGKIVTTWANKAFYWRY